MGVAIGISLVLTLLLLVLYQDDSTQLQPQAASITQVVPGAAAVTSHGTP